MKYMPLLTIPVIYFLQQGYKETFSFLQRYVQRQRLSNESADIEAAPVTPSTSNVADSPALPRQPVFYMDDEEAYNEWICSLETDNVPL